MIEHLTVIVLALIAGDVSSTRVETQKREQEIERCTAIAEMVASAYVTHPVDVGARTDRINRGKKELQALLGTSDMHLMSAYGAMAF